MLSTLLLFCLICSGSAEAGSEIEYSEIIPRCSDSPLNMTFTPVEGYVGRYTAELCTNYTQRKWELEVNYYNTRDYCNASYSGDKLLPGTRHSYNVELIKSNNNCTANQTVCMSAQFDMIFSSCYSITTSFITHQNQKQKRYKHYYFDVVNPYSKEHFAKNRATVDLIYDIDYMSVTWHTGIPPSVYKVEIANETDSNEQIHLELVPNCTTIEKTTIKCYLSLNYGCYIMHLTHIAPWISGIFWKQEVVPLKICRNETRNYVSKASGTENHLWVWILLGVSLALALVGACACLVRRAIKNINMQKAVLRWWLNFGDPEAVTVIKPTRQHVLLLYARESALAAKAICALKTALEQVVDGQVYDIFAPDVMALCASAPAEWIRSMLLRSDVAVVLLQSPALQCLYTTQTADTDSGVKLISPLLGNRVVPRSPHFGDALLQMALRICNENLQPKDSYWKYYIATIPDLPTEIVPCLVPFRRYPLPSATSLLLKDISPISPNRSPPTESTESIEIFSRLLTEFVDYVKENPDYLMDELMVLDT